MDPKLIEILICPITAKRLRLSKDKKLLVTIDEKLAYPIIDGIPRLSPEDVIDDFKKENKDINFWVVIPARLKSTRFPEKMLANIMGKSMISRVVEKAIIAEHPES